MSGADAGAGTDEGVTVRAVVVDDHPVVRDGLVAMLGADPGIEVVGSAEDGSEGLRLIERTDPDVVLMDLRMPGTGGTEAIRRLRSRDRERPRVLVLTTYDTDSAILRAIEAGATGYLLKDTPAPQLLEAIASAASGRTTLAPAAASVLASSLRGPRPEELTGRELEVLRLVAEGLSNSQIGTRLSIAESTVKSHLLRVFAKLGVDDRTRAVTLALERGLL